MTSCVHDPLTPTARSRLSDTDMGGRLRHGSDALSTSRLYTVSFLFYLFSLTSAIPQNITIDDQFGDEQTGVLPGYSPVGAWSQGADCSRCLIKPDASQALRGTWHDATHTPGDEEPRVASLQFNGTAIYAYFIIPNTVQFATTLTNTTFELDGEFVGRFEHVPTSAETFEFNVPGYVNTTLPPGQHQFNIIGTGDTNASVILFDYAVYTFDPMPILSSSSPPTSSAPQQTSTTSTPPTVKSSSTGVIVGSVIGALALIAIIIIAFLFCYRRRRQRKSTGADEITNVAQVEPFLGEVVRADISVATHDRSRSVFGHEAVNNAISGSSFTPSSSTSLLRSHDNTAPSPESASSFPRSGVAQVQPDHSPQPQPQGRSRTQTRTSMRNADSKSSQRQELQQRMEDVQNTIATLRHQASLRVSSPNRPGLHVQNSDSNTSTAQLGDVSDTASLASPMFGQDTIGGSQVGSVTAREDFGGRGGETEPLRQRIAELQAEVEMLRAQQDLLRVNDEPPPVYEESDRDPVMRDRSRSTR